MKWNVRYHWLWHTFVQLLCVIFLLLIWNVRYNIIIIVISNVYAKCETPIHTCCRYIYSIHEALLFKYFYHVSYTVPKQRSWRLTNISSYNSGRDRKHIPSYVELRKNKKINKSNFLFSLFLLVAIFIVGKQLCCFSHFVCMIEWCAYGILRRFMRRISIMLQYYLRRCIS